MSIDINVYNEIVEINETSQIVEINASSAIIEYDPTNLITNVRNQTGSSIGKFKVVYISGATGNKPLITLASNTTEAASSKTYGVTRDVIANNGTGYVVTVGELRNVNTSAFNEGDQLWLGTNGNVLTAPPAEPAHAVFIGFIVRKHPTLGVVDVRIQNGYELNELHGVEITNPTNGQVLKYNSATGLWVNSTDLDTGITSLNSLTALSQTFATGTSGTDFNISSATSTHTFNLPTASATNRGLLSSADWSTFNNKQATISLTTTGSSGSATFISNTLNVPTYTLTGLGGVPTSRTLTINGTSYDLSADRTWTIPSDNIYNSDGTLTGNRVMSSGGFTLTLNPDTSLSGSLFGNTLRTRTAFGTSSTQTGTVFANVDLTFPGTSSQNNTLFMGQQQITNTGSGSSLVYGQGIDIQQHLLAKSATARVQANNYILQYRGYTDDISTNAFNQMNGLYIISGHWANQTTTNIVTGTLRGYYNILRNHGGTIQNIYGYAAFADLGGTSIATQNSTTSNYFAVFSSGQVGSSQVGVTHTVSNYYGLYIAAPTIGTNGSISNRWGIYANDTAMLNVISGDTVIGSTISAGYKLDVVGTLRVSGNSTFTTLAGSGSRMVIADANGLLSTQSIPTGNITGTGASGQITYWTGTSTQTGSNNLFWDASNNRLGIGTASPSVVAEIVSADATMNVRNTSNTGFAGMNMYDDGSSLTGSFQIGGSLVQPSTLRGNMFIGARKSTGNLIFIRGVAATQSGALFSSGNWLFQDGGTFTDAGYKVDIAGTTRIQTINAATIDTDKFLVSDSGEIKFRTGAELLSDIGGQAALTNPVTGTGTSGQVAYWSGTTTQTGSNNLFWDNANNRLGIGITTPDALLRVAGDVIIRPASGGTNVTIGGTQPSAGASPDANFTLGSSLSNNLIIQTFRSNSPLINSSNNHLRIAVSNVQVFQLFNTTGNLLLQNGGTFTDGGQRLQVQGDAFIKGSGTTSATSALTIQDNGGSHIINVKNNRSTNIYASTRAGGAGVNFGTGATGTAGLNLFSDSIFFNQTGSINYSVTSGSQANSGGIQIFNTSNFNPTTTSPIELRIGSIFEPTSGTATYTNTLLNPTINQTGGANGITRGLYVNPTLTAAADWRSIETSNNTGWAAYFAGSADIFVGDGADIQVGATNGTKIGTATSQKIGFWNATPIVQPTTAVASAAFFQNTAGAAVYDNSTFDGYTIQQVVKALRNAGLLA